MTNTPSPNDLEQWHTDLSVGEILRRTRTHYNLTLEQIEAAIRIRAVQLDAIERMDIAKLPGRVYAIGFVRTYAEYLGLDGGRIIHLFKTQSIGHKPKEELSFPVMAKESQLPGAPLAIGGVVGALLLILIWIFFFSGKQDGKESIPPLPEEEMQESITEAPPIGIEQTTTTGQAGAPAPGQEGLSPAPDPVSVLTPAAPERRVILRIQENSWIEIRKADGSILLRQILKAGDEYLVPQEQGLVLATGNAGGFTVVVDGKDIPKLGGGAQVRRNVSLNPEDLLKNIEKERPTP